MTYILSTQKNPASNLGRFNKVCTQHSVSFKKEEGMRERQAFPYRSKEWEVFHRHARNSIESLNAGVKDLGREAFEESSRRRVRGLAAAQIFVTMLLTNYNLRRIAAFLANEANETDSVGGVTKDPSTPALRRRRDREWHNKYTGTYPDGYEKPVTLVDATPLRT